jgi:hypothetical protein
MLREVEKRAGVPHSQGKSGPAVTKEEILRRLEGLVRKVKTQHHDSSDVDFRIFSPQTSGMPYLVEVSKGRFVQRVSVDSLAVRRLILGQPDSTLVRSLRTAMLAVARLAGNSE